MTLTAQAATTSAGKEGGENPHRSSQRSVFQTDAHAFLRPTIAINSTGHFLSVSQWRVPCTAEEQVNPYIPGACRRSLVPRAAKRTPSRNTLHVRSRLRVGVPTGRIRARVLCILAMSSWHGPRLMTFPFAEFLLLKLPRASTNFCYSGDERTTIRMRGCANALTRTVVA